MPVFAVSSMGQKEGGVRGRTLRLGMATLLFVEVISAKEFITIARFIWD